MKCSVAFACLASAIPIAGQTPPPHRFEVVSVKLNRTTDPRTADMKVLPGGKVVITNVPLLMIVAAAWDVPFQSPRLTGGREWAALQGERYDIVATPEPGAIAPDLLPKERGDLVRPLMQALLEDRFHLKMRAERKDQPVYALVVAKDGPKLEKSMTQEKDCVASENQGQTPCHRVGGGQGRGIHGEAVSLQDVALFVQNWSDRPVIDQTGLTNLYNIQTEGWAPMRMRPPNADGSIPKGDAGIDDADRQTLADVFRQLGIVMESRRVPVDMFFVEHVEAPQGN
jgi:uncharacterized protein (TIGR03435 family)